MNIEKIKNGNYNLAMLQLISPKINIINKSKSESRHKDLNNIKYLNYKILLQEKDNNILKLIAEKNQLGEEIIELKNLLKQSTYNSKLNN